MRSLDMRSPRHRRVRGLPVTSHPRRPWMTVIPPLAAISGPVALDESIIHPAQMDRDPVGALRSDGAVRLLHAEEPRATLRASQGGRPGGLPVIVGRFSLPF